MSLTDITGFYLPNFQGILGISPSNPLNPEIESYLQVLFNQGKIEDPIISFSLTQLLTQESKAIYGGMDRTQYVGNMYVMNLGATNLWAPHVNGVAYGNSYLDKFDNSDNFLAIIDTGSTLIHLPKKYYNIMVDWWMH